MSDENQIKTDKSLKSLIQYINAVVSKGYHDIEKSERYD